MALTKITGQVINDTTGLVVGVTTVGGGVSAVDGFFSGIVTFSNDVSIAGTLTYEDVTNIDAVGLVTARNGIVVGSGITLSKDGDVFFTGIATGNGSGLTALNASNLASGTVPTARLGSGTASSSTFLRGDSTFAAVTSTTINTNADNRVITGSDTANTLNGESTLTFNNGQLDVTQTTSASDAKLVVRNSNTPGSGSLRLEFHYGTGNTEGTDRFRFGYVEGYRQGGSNDGGLKFGTKPDNASAPTERLRIDSSGRLLGGNYYTSQQIGAVTAPVQIQGTSQDTSALSLFRYSNDTGGSTITLGKGRGSSGGDADKPQENDTVGTIHFHIANNNDLVNGNVAAIDVQVDAEPGGGDTPGRIRFLTSPDGSSTLSERVRITKDGDFLVGRTNTITIASDPSNACFEQLTDNGMPLTLHCDQSNQRGFGIYYTSGKNASDFIRCQIASSPKFLVTGSGNTQNANNSYGSISDVSLKENIVDANSQWDDIKNIRVRNYNFKESTGQPTHTQIGVVAQELETVSPKLVETSDKDGMKNVQYSVLYMKSVKALQEAMARIETLEAKVAALEGS